MKVRTCVRLVASLVALGSLLLGTGLAPVPAGAQGSQPPDSVVLGARWLASQLTPEGYVEGLFAPGPDPDATRDVAFTLAATGLEQESFNAAIGWIKTNIEEVIAPGDEPDGAGTLGVLIMIAVAVGDDPRNFGGVDLIVRLEATLGQYEAGLYGEADPTFDGVLRQSLALLGLDSAGVTPAASAVTWLNGQQCGLGRPTAPASEGGFQNYSPPNTACGEPNASTYSGAETDATAVALSYYAGVDDQGRSDDAAAFLRSSQSPGGGFPWYVGDVDSPNSTALAIMGLFTAGGEESFDAGLAAIAWLEDQQLGCDSPDAGAFTSSYSDGAADQFATRQAVLGVAGVTLPLNNTGWSASGDPCEQPDPGPGPGPGPAPSPTPISTPATPKFTG